MNVSVNAKTARPGWRRAAFLALLSLAAICMAIAAIQFPYDVDAPASARETEELRRYYADAYRQSSTAPREQTASEYETKYLRVAAKAAEDAGIPEMVQSFVNRFDLRQRPVLEIGSGRGYLQDVAVNYTGLDISPTVSRFYHKKFVLGSATALPFANDSFDGAWSIWVLEHVPNPEQSLRELRRVMRDKGTVLLCPAWNCKSWAANGYAVRPYSDFNYTGKLIKASIPVRDSLLYRSAVYIPGRVIRNAASRVAGPSTLRYRRLVPNYKEYWQGDSDAVNSIDRYDVMLWFRSRGDKCLNCDGMAGSVFMKSDPLIIQIHKSESPHGT
jgi:SAM-dependent methyltransferase